MMLNNISQVTRKPLITKKEAIKLGLKRFNTGSPCFKGHLSERLVSSGACIECNNEKKRKYKPAPKVVNSNCSSFLPESLFNRLPESFQKLLLAEEVEEINKQKKLKRKKQKCYVNLYSGAKRRAEEKGGEFNLTLDYIKQIFPADWKCPALQIEMCPGDGASTNYSPTVDRIDPNGDYVIGNVQIISRMANNIKSNGTAEQIAKVAAFAAACEKKRNKNG